MRFVLILMLIGVKFLIYRGKINSSKLQLTLSIVVVAFLGVVSLFFFLVFTNDVFGSLIEDDGGVLKCAYGGEYFTWKFHQLKPIVG